MLVGAAPLVNEDRHEPGPAGLVRGAQPLSVVAMEVLVEEDEIAPVRVLLELRRCPVHRRRPDSSRVKMRIMRFAISSAICRRVTGCLGPPSGGDRERADRTPCPACAVTRSSGRRSGTRPDPRQFEFPPLIFTSASAGSYRTSLLGEAERVVLVVLGEAAHAPRREKLVRIQYPLQHPLQLFVVDDGRAGNRAVRPARADGTTSPTICRLLSRNQSRFSRKPGNGSIQPLLQPLHREERDQPNQRADAEPVASRRPG